MPGPSYLWAALAEPSADAPVRFYESRVRMVLLTLEKTLAEEKVRLLLINELMVT